MSRAQRQQNLASFARAGFQDLTQAREQMAVLAEYTDTDFELLLGAFSLAADADVALARAVELASMHGSLARGFDSDSWQRLALLFGSSPALASFFCRHPERLQAIVGQGGRVIALDEARTALLESVGAATQASSPVANLAGEQGANALRVRYRELLAELMMFDLIKGLADEAALVFDEVATSLSSLAEAALEAALAVARATVIEMTGGTAESVQNVHDTRLAILALGKCGAGELNVVSDVDVLFIAEPMSAQEPSNSDPDTVLRTATKLATETMRAIHDPQIEVPLWQVDANLRPEGRQGPLVRSLSSTLNYYDRWAKTWEFQALLKARPVAGDLDLGAEFVAHTQPLVWTSSNREDFVGNVQRMRERVTEHIDTDDIEYQLKLGPGGLRDIEFSVQLLQLVHGQYDESLRLAGTLPALQALVSGGYVAREDGELLAWDYRQLRVLEHRLQLRDLRRTALMPRDAEGLRVLARSSHLAPNAETLESLWRSIRNEVRELHLKIFYAPLLGAVAALPGEGLTLGTEQARTRLQSIGFRDPDGAMRHLAALTKGTSRTARIQRNLLPALLPWLAQGTDPDFGLLSFRRVSEASLDNPWYLRLLRDGSEAAERLTRVLSTSRFAAELLETLPDAVAWLEKDSLLQPTPLATLKEEMRALVSRRNDVASAAHALRAVHRREVLRLALGRLVCVIDDAEVSVGLDAAHTALLDSLLLALRASPDAESSDETFELALIGMGRYGGQELGFASDLDLLAVYRVRESADPQQGQHSKRDAARLITQLRSLVDDPRFQIDLDFDLRPEGKNGPLVRSLEAYRTYYERWSLTWEAQALLRARPVAGDAGLAGDFMRLADSIRYPQVLDDAAVREVRRLKARVEAERLPQGAEPKRHLKLGPGGLSDVEWLVQLLQLQHGHKISQLRTTSTLRALAAAVQHGLLEAADRAKLESAWMLASSIRSAAKLSSGRLLDTLPNDRGRLEGIAGVLGMPSGHTTELEERWFAASRRARLVFEREFFGYDDDPQYSY